MTYLPENIFKNILSYCGYEEIERRQRQNNKLVFSELKEQNYIPNHRYNMERGIRDFDFIYKNYIDYELEFYDRDTKLRELKNTKIIYKGFLLPKTISDFGYTYNPIVRLVSITKCLNLRKDNSLIAKIKFAKNWNRLDCDCCNGVRKAKENKEIVLCELLKKPITWRGGGFCYTGLCEEIKQRC